MYFVRYEPLKTRLRQREIGDREALPYLVMFFVLEVIATSLPTVADPNRWDIFGSILTIGATVWGVLYGYRCNGKESGYDFIHKFVVLGWVVGIRLALFVLPLTAAVYFVAVSYGLVEDASTPFDALYFSAISLLFYQRIGRHIADTRGHAGEPAAIGDGDKPHA